jgi:hypothetical protein
MLTGNVTKLVKGFGSTWGRVRPDRRPEASHSPDVFFNVASLEDPYEFPQLYVGSAVQFNVQRDRANGMIALHMTIVRADGTPGLTLPANGALL